MTRLHWPRRAALALALVVVSIAGTAAAQQVSPQVSPQFTREYQDGIDAYRLGQYAEARTHLRRAAELEPKLPGPHRWLAAVDLAEEKWDDCIANARRAIKLNPQSSEIVATRELHDQCRTAAGRTPFAGDFENGGALAVTSNASGATVSVNGLRYGVTPLAPRALAAGAIDVEVVKPGFLPRKLEVDILPRVVTDVEVTLEPDPKAVAAAEVKPAERPDATLPSTGWITLKVDVAGAAIRINGMDATADARGRYERPPGTYEVVVTAPGRERWRRRVRVARGQVSEVAVTLPSPDARRGPRIAGAAFVTGAAAMAGAGIALGVLSARANEDARDWWEIERTRPTPDILPIDQSARIAPIHTREEIAERADDADRYALYSAVAYGAAVVTLGAGIYFLVHDRSAERDGAPPPFAIAPVVGDREVGVHVRAEWGW